ncbi:DUF4249 domain-containing protein [Paludibacter sp. 221]|uniref:DUF4249 domain-containing protein n=1 Tax=Paludibacter sp. 221 TaxID=2302939 RepID=UPI0013D13D9D|nr:DUF4249 domain-containing protein [Paludibacter sp. 221]NDV45618.1 DUF4249 domain-containing protein [Paludibacter sp. 221]
MKKHYYILLALLPALVSCEFGVNLDEIPYEPKIVVEGRIENNTYASVLLSVSAPVLGEQDTIKLLNHVIRSARVTVSDGETSEVLRLAYSPDHLPPYEYKGHVIRGEVGKNYSLKIEYDNKIITATTHIPEPVDIDDIWFRRNSENDTTGYIGVSFKNTSNQFYSVATSPYSVKGVFTPCLYGNVNSSHYPAGEQIDMELRKGPSIYPKNNFKTYYLASDTIRIKLCTQPRSAYDFWTSYQNEIINTQNPLFPAFSSLKSNIEGGIGIWSGYGSVTYGVILAKIER